MKVPKGWSVGNGHMVSMFARLCFMHLSCIILLWSLFWNTFIFPVRVRPVSLLYTDIDVVCSMQSCTLHICYQNEMKWNIWTKWIKNRFYIFAIDCSAYFSMNVSINHSPCQFFLLIQIDSSIRLECFKCIITEFHSSSFTCFFLLA